MSFLHSARERLSTTAFMPAAVVFFGLLTGAAHGTTLYFDYNQNTVGGTANSSVFLFGTAGQTATVSSLSGFNQNVTLGANGFFNLGIPVSYAQGGTGIRNTGFQVVSPNPIGGYFINRAPNTTDMTYLLDQASLGTNYVVASQGGGYGEGSQAMIHATQNNTAVTFTPKGGAPINVILQAGQTYKYAGGTTNLTGSSVSADKPVAVFGGHECAQVPVGTIACDVLLEQMIPNNKLSKTYALTASQGSNSAASLSDLVRVIATENATVIKVGGATVATLAAGDFYEFSLASDTGVTVTGSAPVMVAQYLKGAGGSGSSTTDPALALVPGSDAWIASYHLATPSGAQDFLVDYASIVLNTADLGSLVLNGAGVNTAGFTLIPGTAYSRGNVTLPNGVFDMSASNPFLLMLGGGSLYDSYFTFGGSTFAPGVSPPVDPVNGVPEPSTLALLMLCLSGLAFSLRNKKAN